ncbi:10623_t:CDS:2 [Racocetra persica]|uniref:10623_t:CDS:1 n=1 Tax=Racocetra persica TaxID=160502 RepID=A0ACA9R8M9_9GLOM|nr:10623_t:CDS:2 [Racocetra persica]
MASTSSIPSIHLNGQPAIVPTDYEETYEIDNTGNLHKQGDIKIEEDDNNIYNFNDNQQKYQENEQETPQKKSRERKRSKNDLKENIIKKQAIRNIESEQNNSKFIRKRKVSNEKRTHKNRNKETWQEAKERDNQKLKEEYKQIQVQKEQKWQEKKSKLNEQYKEQPYNQKGLEIGIDEGSQSLFIRPTSGRFSIPILLKDDY